MNISLSLCLSVFVSISFIPPEKLFEMPTLAFQMPGQASFDGDYVNLDILNSNITAYLEILNIILQKVMAQCISYGRDGPRPISE